MLKSYILGVLLIQLVLILALSFVTPKIRVHVIPHSHDDVGWLRTMEEYYSGSYCVRCILENMLEGLASNKERTFVYVEMAFFEKWYTDQSESRKAQVKEFVREGRLEFANGGWVMNDEACAASQDIIDQMRLGMSFLHREFNFTPKVAWYLDPFGHSKTNAVLMAKLGFENMVMVRIDYKEKELRKKNREMEFVWKPYDQIDEGESKIFTHITYDHYSPRGRLWDNMFAGSINVDKNTAREALQYFSKQASVYRTSNLLFLYGDDFTFASGQHPFSNMDKLISTLNSDFSNEIEIFYSLPSRYFKDIKKENEDWPEWKDFDFFPYSDDPKAYWTGYFSSRPYLKGFIRDVRQYFHHSAQLLVKQVQSRKITHKAYLAGVEDIKRTLAIAQHHDAVSGTARENVSEDYISMMDKSITLFKTNLVQLLFGSEANVKVCIPSNSEFGCFESQYDFDREESQTFIFLNYEKNSHHPVQIRTNTKNVTPTSEGKDVDFDVYCYQEEKECYLTFLIDFSSSFFRIYKLEKSKSTKFNLERKNFTDESESLQLYENGNIKVSFSLKGGFNYEMRDQNDTLIKHNFSFLYGTLWMNGDSTIRSWSDNPGGAYIMAPSSVTPHLTNVNMQKSFYFVSENLVHLVLDFNWCYLRVTLRKKEVFDGILETQTVMPPLDDDDKEYLLIVQSDLDNFSKEFNNLEFMTDTNGDLLTRRVKDFRFGWKYEKDEAIADNFYPVNSVISLRDNKNKSKVLSIWNDRSQSATSVERGQIYMVLNRKSNRDDKRGLADGLHEQRNSQKNYQFNHIVTIGKDFKKKFVRDLIHKRPLTVNFKGESTLETKSTAALTSLKATDFEFISGDLECLDVYFYPTEENKFLLQITNYYSDPFFTANSRCSFFFNLEYTKSDYKISEVQMNGTGKFPSALRKAWKFISFASFRESASLMSQYTLKQFETVTFLIEQF